MVSLGAVLLDYFGPEAISDGNNLDLTSMLFTILTMITIIFERMAVIQWIREKKDYENKPIHEYIYMAI